jgi:hypothetical protein
MVFSLKSPYCGGTVVIAVGTVKFCGVDTAPKVAELETPPPPPPPPQAAMLKRAMNWQKDRNRMSHLVDQIEITRS